MMPRDKKLAEQFQSLQEVKESIKKQLGPEYEEVLSIRQVAPGTLSLRMITNIQILLR